MINRTLKQIHEMIGGLNNITEWESVNIAGVSIDSRKVTTDNLFVPLTWWRRLTDIIMLKKYRIKEQLRHYGKKMFQILQKIYRLLLLRIPK